MSPLAFISQDENLHLIMLIYFSSLTEEGKDHWRVMLPLMDPEEKAKLRDILTEDVVENGKIQQEAVEEFYSRLK